MMKNKPISVARREYIQSVVDLTNNSGLPMFTIVDILDGILKDARNLAETEYQRDLAAYKQQEGAEEHADT